MAGRSVRGDALLASVKPGGGGWRTWNDALRLAAGGVVLESTLTRVLLVEGGKFRPGPVSGEGALEQLARQVEAESRPKKPRHWLECAAPWALDAIGEELAAAGLARLVRRRFLRVFLPQPYLEIVDQATQDDIYRLIRETMPADGPTMPDAALLVLLAGSPHRHVQMKQREARRRFRDLQASLPDGVRVAWRAYEKWDLGDAGG